MLRTHIQTEDELYYHQWFSKMAANRASVVLQRREDEERYFSDVDGTRTQFTTKQLSEIEKNYDIPVSTKISFAIIEQILSFLSGSKPYPRLIAPSEAEESRKFTQLYEQAHNACWYESHGNDELTSAFRDMLVPGSGYMHVRKNDFFGETTFNVINEYVPWTDVYVDPSSRRSDLSDAEMIVIAKVLPLTKAEKEYDIKLDEEDYVSSMLAESSGFDKDPYLFPSYATGGWSNFKNDRYVWTRLFYEKKQVSLYISENNDLASKRPKPIMIPNEKKLALGQAIQEMIPQMQQAQQGYDTSILAGQQAQQEVQTSGQPEQALGQQQAVDEGNAEHDAQAQQMLAQFQALQQQFEAEPDEIPAYAMETIIKDKKGTPITKVVHQVERVKRKQIVRVLMVGSKLLEKDILPCQEFPVVHFCLAHNRSPNKTYGLMHYIKDIEKAMNKCWAGIIYDMSLNSHQKVLAPESSIVEQSKWESAWAKPGTILTYSANPDLPNGGIPQIIPATPIDSARVQLVSMLTNLAEYVTGIYGVIQGNQQGAPDTFGGMSSLQNFGTQRVKLYGRHVESALEQLALVTVEYLQAYAPRDKILQYFDGSGNAQEIQLLDGGQDLRFKVRVNVANNLPTSRHLAAQLMATVAGQSSNPAVGDLLVENSLRMMDIPEADTLVQKIDMVKQLQSQIQQLGTQLKESESRNKSLENQNYQQSLASHIDSTKKDITQIAEQAEHQLETQPENEEVDLY